MQGKHAISHLGTKVSLRTDFSNCSEVNVTCASVDQTHKPNWKISQSFEHPTECLDSYFFGSGLVEMVNVVDRI